MTHVTLVRPPTLVAKWAHTTPTCPPIGLAYVAGALRHAGHDVHAVDAVGEASEQMLETDDRRFLSHGLSVEDIVARVPANTKVIGISCMFSHEWPLTRDIIDALDRRFPEARIVAGGEHVTALPAFSLNDCRALDACVVGEGEETFVELIDAFDHGRPLRKVAGVHYRDNDSIADTGSRMRIRQIDDIPPPAWELFPLETYLDRGYGFGAVSYTHLTLPTIYSV